MTTTEFLAKNIVTIISTAVIIGGLFWQVKSFGKRLDDMAKKDASHDEKIARHDTDIAVLKTEVESQKGVMASIQKKVDAIYQIMVSKNND